MNKIGQSLVLGVSLFALVLSNMAYGASKSRALGDFHMSFYLDAYGQVSGFELFTKVIDKEAYLGLSCSGRSPFPMLQILLFNDEVLTDSPKLLKVSYQIKSFEDLVSKGGKQIQPSDVNVVLQGILQPVDTADEYSNKVRLELDSMQVKTMRGMQLAYGKLLQQLKQGGSIAVNLNHRAFGERQYEFSLKGLKALLEPHESICR